MAYICTIAPSRATGKLASLYRAREREAGRVWNIVRLMSLNPDALRSMLPNMCHGAKIALLGILPPATAIDWDLVVFNGLTIKGIYGREMYETWYKMTVMIQSGLDITPVITHLFHYTEYEKAFEIMRSGKSGKVILNWVED